MIKRSIVDDIVKKMTEQAYESSIKSKMKELSDMVYPILWEDAPGVVKELHLSEFRDYLDLKRVFSIRIPAESSLDVYLEGGYPSMFTYKEITNPEVIETAKSVKKLHSKKWKFRNQLFCAIRNISSIKKLKDEFPEAYEVYLEITNTPQPKKSGCDSIEAVRAQLSKLTKEEVCSQESQPREEQ